MSGRPDHPRDDAAIADRRRRARRTALVIGVVAVVIYGLFILTGVLAQ